MAFYADRVGPEEKGSMLFNNFLHTHPDVVETKLPPPPSSSYLPSHFGHVSKLKGVYPQSDVSLVMIDTDASKGFVDLWVHLSLVIFAIFDLKRQLKLLEMACETSPNMLNISLAMGMFLLKLVEMLSGYTYFRWISMIS